MPLSNGCNHIALVTEDLERLIDFYSGIFEAEVLVDMDEGPVRHALIDLGSGFCLHPFEFRAGSAHAVGSQAMFDRGHLDHLAINVDDPDVFELLRARLVEAHATDGTVTDFGAVRTVWFLDPDGMGCEIATWASGAPRALEDRVQEAYAPTAAAAHI